MPKPPSRSAPVARLADADFPSLDGVTAWPASRTTVHTPAGSVTLQVRTTSGSDGEPSRGEPALLVHGLGGSALNWTDYAGLLRDRLAVESIDLPGHGGSDPAPGNRYTPQTHADAVTAYLEQSGNDGRGRGAVHLVGNSMGGAISILVAAQRPDLVRSLTLVSPAVPDNRIRIHPLKANPRFAFIIVPVLGEWLTRQFTKRYAAEVRAKGTIALCFADRSRFPQQRLDELVAEMREREKMSWADAAVLRSTRGLARSQLLRGRSGWRLMRDVKAPTLVVWGDTDRLVAPDLAAYVAAAIPDSRLLELEHIGHTAMMEDPVITARATVGLLDDL
ncbi:alpha/beta hydrolase [Jatrophihabitans fulvus]